MQSNQVNKPILSNFFSFFLVVNAEHNKLNMIYKVLINPKVNTHIYDSEGVLRRDG